jgi:hypothetical protein
MRLCRVRATIEENDMKKGQELRCGSWLAGPLMVLAFYSVCVSAPIMVERNLFAQDRKPPTDEPAPAAPRGNAPGLSAKAIQLDGVFIHGDTKEALLRVKGQMPGKNKDKGQTPYVTVREGEKIADYQVVKIESRSVSLEKDGQIVVVNLFAEGKVVPPAPPVPLPPGAVQTPDASTPDAHDAQAGQGTMRLPHPVPPPGRGGMQPGADVPNMVQPPQEPPPSVSQDVNAPGDEAAPEDEDQIEEESTDDSNS